MQLLRRYRRDAFGIDLIISNSPKGDSMKQLLISILIFTLPSIFAQAPDTLWTNLYGGSQSEEGYSVIETSDGGLFILASTNSFGMGSTDAWLIRTDSNGDTLWTKTYGGSNSDFLFDIADAQQGNFILSGGTNSFGSGDFEVWFVKINSNGDILWSKTYSRSAYEYCASITATSDGNFVAGTEGNPSGSAPGGFWFLKLNTSGDTLWTTTYQTNEYSLFNQVESTNDGGTIGIGTTETDINILIKHNSAGDQEWVQNLTGLGRLKSLKQIGGGGYVLVGDYNTPNFNRNIRMITTDAIGQIIMDKQYGSGGLSASKIIVTNDGGYIVIGVIRGGNIPASGELFFFRIDTNGDSLWLSSYGSGFNDGDNYANDVIQTSNNGYILIGRHSKDFNYQAWVIRLNDEPTAIFDNAGMTLNAFTLSQNYPNPFNPQTTISYQLYKAANVELSVFNTLGQRIYDSKKEQQQAGSYSIAFDGASLPSGLYMYRLQAGNFSETKKMILLK